MPRAVKPARSRSPTAAARRGRYGGSRRQGMSNAPPIDQAVVLCGGSGTRLGTLTTASPTPWLPVGGRPFLDVLLGGLGRSGIRRIVLLAGFAAERITEYVAASPLQGRFDLTIEVAIEPSPAGTAGALWHARQRLDDRFFLLNGDSWFDIPLAGLAARLTADSSTIGVLALRHVGDTTRFGTVAIAGARIVRFTERPARPGPGLTNGGVYAFRRP